MTTPDQAHHRKWGARSAVAAFIGAALVISACGSSSKAPSSGGSATTTGSSATSAAGGGNSSVPSAQADVAKFLGQVTQYPTLPAISGVSGLKGKNIWYVPIGSAVPILAGFGVGVQQAVTKLGMNYHTCDGKFLPTTIAACLDQAASQGADAVIAGYIDYALVPTAFDNLVAHHIPVYVGGESADGGKTTTPQLAFGDTSATINLLQRLDDESVIVDSNGKAKILFIGTTDSPGTIGGATYSKKFFAQNCPGCTFTEIDYNTSAIQRVPSQVSAALISNPDTTYVVVELDAAASGALSGIQTAGFTTKVKMAGTNGGLDSLQRIRAGQVQFADAGTSPIFYGWQLTDGIIRMLLGQVPVNNLGIARLFNKTNVGDLTLTPAAYATNAWYGDDSFQQPFLTAWGAS